MYHRAGPKISSHAPGCVLDKPLLVEATGGGGGGGLLGLCLFWMHEIMKDTRGRGVMMWGGGGWPYP